MMKKLKKIILIVSALLLISAGAAAAFGQEGGSSGNPSCTLKASVNEGEETGKLDVILSLRQDEGSCGLNAVSFYLQYDEEAFHLSSVDTEDYNWDGSPYSFSEELAVNPYRCGWIVAGSATPSTYSGNLVRFTFDVKETIVPGKTYTFAVTDAEGGCTMMADGHPVTVQADFTLQNCEYTFFHQPAVVSGKVKSYNPGHPLTIQLCQNDSVKYAAVIEESNGSGQVTQDFRIEGVAEGTYDLKVMKEGHLTYTIQGVVVGNEDVDLTASSKQGVQLITMLAGDMDGNGSINVNDLNTVWNAKNYNKSAKDPNVDPITDIDGNGSINVNDLNIVWNSANYNKGEKDCTVSYM